MRNCKAGEICFREGTDSINVFVIMIIPPSTPNTAKVREKRLQEAWGFIHSGRGQVQPCVGSWATVKALQRHHLSLQLYLPCLGGRDGVYPNHNDGSWRDSWPLMIQWSLTGVGTFLRFLSLQPSEGFRNLCCSITGSQSGHKCGYYRKTTSYTHLLSCGHLMSIEGAYTEFLLSGHFLVP